LVAAPLRSALPRLFLFCARQTTRHRRSPVYLLVLVASRRLSESSEIFRWCSSFSFFSCWSACTLPRPACVELCSLVWVVLFGCFLLFGLFFFIFLFSHLFLLLLLLPFFKSFVCSSVLVCFILPPARFHLGSTRAALVLA
ncbi:unnamed protein product, partial [Pylaiella littoralis]